MSYKIHLDLYIGLSHGQGAPHYSNRELRRLLKESQLGTSPATLIPAMGVEAGVDEDTVILRMIWPPLSSEDVGLRCAALNDFLSRVFTDLHQRWVLLAFETMHRGVPVKKDDIDLSAGERSRVMAVDLLPASALAEAAVPRPTVEARRSVTEFVTALIPIPFDGPRSRKRSHERALTTTAEELARRFGGGVLWRPDDRLIQGYWWKQGIIQRQDISLIEVDVPDRASNLRWLKTYVGSTLLQRFQQEAIYVKFVRPPQMVT